MPAVTILCSESRLAISIEERGQFSKTIFTRTLGTSDSVGILALAQLRHTAAEGYVLRPLDVAVKSRHASASFAGQQIGICNQARSR